MRFSLPGKIWGLKEKQLTGGGGGGVLGKLLRKRKRA